jgi:hypothetical protein
MTFKRPTRAIPNTAYLQNQAKLQHCDDRLTLSSPHHVSFPIQRGILFAMASRQFTVDLAKKKEFINIFLLMPESSVLNARRLCRRRDGVVALVMMALLPLPMCRHLAVVDNDGDGVKGDDDNDGATGNDKDDDPDDVTDDEVEDDDGDGATDDNIDDDCDSAMGDNDNTNNDNHDNVTGDDDDDDDATVDDIDKDGKGATGDEVDNDGDGATDDDVINNSDGATGGRHCLDA